MDEVRIEAIANATADAAHAFVVNLDGKAILRAEDIWEAVYSAAKSEVATIEYASPQASATGGVTPPAPASIQEAAKVILCKLGCVQGPEAKGEPFPDDVKFVSMIIALAFTNQRELSAQAEAGRPTAPAPHKHVPATGMQDGAIYCQCGFLMFGPRRTIEKPAPAAPLQGEPSLETRRALVLERSKILARLNSYATNLQGERTDVLYQVALKIHNAGFELAHELAKCGHARANYRDPKYKKGGMEYDPRKCEFCEGLAAAERAGIEKGLERETLLRRELWLSHGHKGIYGDDGEMQCGECGIDYKRASVEAIIKQREENGLRALASAARKETL